MIYNEAWNGVCALYDAVYGPYKEDDEPDPDDDDGFRDGGIDEETNPCDSEDEEEDGWRD